MTIEGLGHRHRLVTLNLDDLASVRQCLELWMADPAYSHVRPLVIRAFESLMQEVEAARCEVIEAGEVVSHARLQLQLARAHHPKVKRRSSKGRRRAHR